MITTYSYFPNSPTTIPSIIKQLLAHKAMSINVLKDSVVEEKKHKSLVKKLRENNARLSAEIALAKSDSSFCLTTSYRNAYEASMITASLLKDESKLPLEVKELLVDYCILFEELYQSLVNNSLDFSDEQVDKEWGSALISKQDWQNGQK